MNRRKLLAALAAGGAGVATWPSATQAAKVLALDLTGTWTNAWYTKLERPKAFKTLVISTAEAEAYEAPRRRLHGELLDSHDVLGQAESEFPENGPGLARIRGEIRTSWITDPPDGRIPWTDEARKRLSIGKEPPDIYDNVENRDTDERCLTNSSGVAPLINSHDANLIEIVQTGDAIVIVGEKNHEARIVRMDGADGLSREAGLGRWTGVSAGRWEGATLVVETTRLRPGVTKLDDDVYLSDRARVVECFTRTGPHEIAYLFRVEDTSLFTRPWRGEMVFRTAEGRMFEYACHEGNYSLPGILAAARAMEREKAGAAKGR